MKPNPKPIDAAWDAFVEQATQPTMAAENLAVLKLAFLHGYGAGLADLGRTSLDEHCMPCAWGALIDDARKAWARQADAVNALRREFDERAKLN